MTKKVILLPLALVLLTGCSMANSMKRSKEAIDYSTCLVWENIAAMEQTNELVKQNIKTMSEINELMGQVQGEN